jgi:uncharacterized protein
MSNKHRFVWHDLNAKDIEPAKRFYGETFNWTFEKSDNGPYLHIKAGTQMIGGFRQKDANEHGPNHWLGYIGVDDVAGTVTKITQNGGKVFMPTTTMDKVGTFAVTADPTGGVFAPWKSARPEEDKEPTGNFAPFTFCWDELLTTDPTAAEKFYTTTFGWTAQHMDMGPMGTYTLLNRPGTDNGRGGEKGAGGIFKSPPGVPHSFWLPYVLVENTDQIADKAKRLGATITVPPTDIPNVGRFATWLDPTQAALGVISMPKQ